MSKEVVDAVTMQRALTRITYEIIERNKGLRDLLFVGIQTRGVYLARRLADRMAQLEGVTVPVGSLDVRNYRDDRNANDSKNIIDTSELPSSIDDQHVILVDDVLYTGRTIRAALDALMATGRPRMISLAVLVDRGHRELPIRPDFVGKNIPTAQNEQIQVSVKEIDGHDNVTIRNIKEEQHE